ncbi:MAG: alpha/beta fold hydrolase [Terriglobales bacterium]
MRSALIFVLGILMSTQLLAQPLPAPSVITDPQQIVSKQNLDLQTLSIEKLYMTRMVGPTAWSPDGKQIAFISNISGRNNLWLVPSAGGWPVQLTISDQRQTRPAWSSNGRWISYMSDKDGDEQWDIFMVSPQTGEVVNLTNTPEVAEEDPTWSPDGRYLAWQTKPKTSSTFEIEVFDTLLRKRRSLTSGTPRELGNMQPLWSPDGKWIAYTQWHATGKDSNVFVAEVATGKSTKLTEHQGEHTYAAADWSPDGKKLLITSNAGNGYDNVALLDIASKKIHWLTQDKWETEAGNFSPDGKLLTWTANVDGNSDIFLCELATRKSVRLPLGEGVNALGGAESAFSRDGSRLLYYHNGPDAPNDVWVYELKKKSPPSASLRVGRPYQVTHSLVAGLRSADMVKPYLVHYPSRDGKFQISAFVYAPYNQERDQRRPAIVFIHGGPQAQTVNSFNRIVQYLVNRGYFVIAPNYRGSTGYGKQFQDANRFDMGGGDLQDVLAAADWIKRSSYIDPKKLVVMGGSYGGYMTMMGLTKAPEMWAAGIAIVPFVNWFTEIENEDPLLREYDLATMGDPVKNKALLEERSPINFVDRIKAPVLLLAGAHDPRCPQEEARQVADSIKKQGGKVELKIYENEGHGFSRVENQIDAYKRVADFLKFWVPAPGCGCSLEE